MRLRQNRTPVEPRALSVEDAAQSIGIGRQLLLKELGRLGLSVVRVGGRVLVRVEDVDTILKAGQAAPEPDTKTGS